MSLKIKPYNPMPGQQRAKRRRQKQSAERLTLVPSSVTCIDTPVSQTSVAGHKCSLVEEKFIPSVNMDGTEDPYSGFPSIEECLEFCSPQDKNIPSANTPTSTNLLSCPDSIIDFQDVSSKFSHQEAYKDDQLKRKALASELNIGRECHNSNNSNTPASTTVSAWESDISISPAESVWSSDAKIPSLIASNISTPASATSPTDQQQISTSRKKDSSANSEGSAQDCRARMADLDVPNTISKDVLSGVDRPVLEFQENIASEPLSSDSSNRLVYQDIQAVHILASSASIMEEESVAEHSDTKLSVTEPSSAVKSLIQVASSSTKRSFSESATASDSQPFISDYCQTSKRLRLTSPLLEEAVSTLLCVQEMISNVLAKLDQGQPHSLIPDVSVQSISDSINVAMDGVRDDSSDNSSSIGSSFDDSDSETELTASKSRCSQQKSTQRCRWTKKDENLLRTLKGNQKRNGGKPSDYQIANKLDRTESGVKQHWDIMMRRERKDSSKH